jgi:hypothetical protein
METNNVGVSFVVSAVNWPFEIKAGAGEILSQLVNFFYLSN